jgi:hypothetical protein
MMGTKVLRQRSSSGNRKAANMTATMLRERFARFGVGLRARIVDFLD